MEQDFQQHVKFKIIYTTTLVGLLCDRENIGSTDRAYSNNLYTVIRAYVAAILFPASMIGIDVGQTRVSKFMPLDFYSFERTQTYSEIDDLEVLKAVIRRELSCLNIAHEQL